MNKAIFLDRDGTLIEDTDYLTAIEEIRIFPGTIEALRKFKSLGFLNIIVTNQSGVARGFLTEEDLNQIHDVLGKRLSYDGDRLLDDIFYSPFHPDGIIGKYTIESDDRKPGTGMIRKAQAKHKIDLDGSFFIGDTLIDMKCAENSGLKKILVGTGPGKDEYIRCQNENIKIDYLAKDIYDASWYIEKINSQKLTND